MKPKNVGRRTPQPRVVAVNQQTLTQGERDQIAAMCGGCISHIRLRLEIGEETLRALMSPEGRVSMCTVERVRGRLEKLAAEPAL